MSLSHSSSIVTNGLILCLDAANPKSSLGRRSLINWDNWITGSGGVVGYNQNGQTSENQRVTDTNPWGNTDVVWEARPLAQTNDDGGWNTDWFNIDNTKMYRYSVWVRRTSSTGGGTFYFGMYANGAGSVRMDNNTVEGNAYWECTASSNLTQNQWYLWVGYVYPFNTTYTGRNPQTGYYTTNGRVGNIGGCNIGSGDLKWSYNSTQGIHRTYLYYCPDSTTRLQFYQPRVDLCDGTEPSIQDLLQDVGNRWRDVSGNGNDFTIQGNMSCSSTAGFSNFTGNSIGTGNRIFKNNFPTNLKSSQGGTGYTVMVLGASTGGTAAWRKLIGNADADNYIDLYQSSSSPYAFYTESGDSLYYNAGTAVANNTLVMPDSVYRLYIATNLNGGTTTNPTTALTIGNETSTGAWPWTGYITVVLMYNRVLTTDEMTQNFNAYRGRYGI